jgi:hypothetical protein
MGQGGAFSWEASCFQSKMKDFLRESFWSVEVMHFLLFSPDLLVSPLRFMTAYVTLGLAGAVPACVPSGDAWPVSWASEAPLA